MSDPKPWSEDVEAGELERALLGAGQAVRLPESERRALWASIALSLPAELAAPTALGASSRLSAYLTKGAIFLAAVGGLGFGASRLWSAHAERAPAKTALGMATTAAHQQPAATPAPVAAVVAGETATAPTPTATPLPAPGEVKARVVSESQLREESAAVLEARSALRAGNAAQSLALLEQARVRFPRGVLGQEREALTIQALAQSGQRAAAARRAQVFLRAHPTSPYVADLRRIAEE